MKKIASGIYHSFPVQLVLLHLQKFQVLLIFWFILFSTISGNFMHSYGADSLFLAPEYMGKVDAISSAILGVAIGIFIMSWNITTFILFSRHFRFLATTSNPFLKYCINNAVIPLIFLIYFLIRAIYFTGSRELMSGWEISLLVAGFTGGLTLLIAISFLYFFRADRSIVRRLSPMLGPPGVRPLRRNRHKVSGSRLIRVEYYLNAILKVKKPREVGHYSPDFIETIFNRHHFAAVVSIFIAFLFLILIGFNLDSPFFQLPAAAGITIFFAILIALSGAFSYFLQSWSMVVLIVLLIGFNQLYKYGVIDPSNKAYGLNYNDRESRPSYTREALMALSSESNTLMDKRNMLEILNRWKKKQGVEKPKLFLVSTSGGGNRSAAFTMNVLQKLDSLSGGTLMDKTFLITGASGGMLGATYFRELSARRGNEINPSNRQYAEDISEDLLNPLFTSFVARDLASPAQKFRVGNYEYIKDRGYSFEQKLNANTRGLLNKQLRDYAEDERSARIPLVMFNSVVTRDGRKMIISTQPVRFLMRPVLHESESVQPEADAIDFQSFFSNQDPMNLRILTAMRMNATFPYVLPNVWLPSSPVIDVMDAGLRDNYGPETAIRFLQVFRDWILENTSGVVVIQIRDRKEGGWEHPFTSENISEIFTRPMLLLQYNWYKMQEYSQNDLFSFADDYLNGTLTRINFQYIPEKKDEGAALNFHLTKSEKINIAKALESEINNASFLEFKKMILPSQAPAALAGRPSGEY